MKCNAEDMMKLSIIVPVYNAGTRIDILLDSVLRNEYNFELICVNDGSTDNTVDIISKRNDPRVTVLSKVNEGTYKAWRYGVQHATGEYVTILDQDDYIEDDYIPFVYDFIDNIGSDVLFTPYYVEEESGSRYVSRIPIEEGLYSNSKLEEIKDKLLGGRVPYAKFTKVIRRSILLDQISNSYQGQIRDFEDWLTLLEVFERIDTLYIKNKAYYHYIQYKNSVSKSSISYRKNMESLNTIINYLENRNIETKNEYLDSFCFYALKCVFNKCIKIKELDLAKEITENRYFADYLDNAVIGKLEKFFIKRKAITIYYYCYLIVARLRGKKG